MFVCRSCVKSKTSSALIQFFVQWYKNEVSSLFYSLLYKILQKKFSIQLKIICVGGRGLRKLSDRNKKKVLQKNWMMPKKKHHSKICCFAQIKKSISKSSVDVKNISEVTMAILYARSLGFGTPVVLQNVCAFQCLERELSTTSDISKSSNGRSSVKPLTFWVGGVWGGCIS